MADPVCSVFEASDDPCQDSRVVVGLEIDVPMRVCLLTEHRGAYTTAVSLDQNVEKGDLAIDFLLGCELDVGVLVIQVFVELMELLLTTTPYRIDVVDVSEPDPAV